MLTRTTATSNPVFFTLPLTCSHLSCQTISQFHSISYSVRLKWDRLLVGCHTHCQCKLLAVLIATTLYISNVRAIMSSDPQQIAAFRWCFICKNDAAILFILFSTNNFLRHRRTWVIILVCLFTIHQPWLYSQIKFTSDGRSWRPRRSGRCIWLIR